MPEAWAAEGRASRILAHGAGRTAGIAAWSIAHGCARPWLGDALPGDLGETPEQAARPVLRMLFRAGC